MPKERLPMHIDPQFARQAVNAAYDHGLLGQTNGYMLEWHRHAQNERSFISDEAYETALRLFQYIKEKKEGQETNPCKTFLTLCPSLRER